MTTTLAPTAGDPIQKQFATFLARHSLAGADLVPMSGDASPRKYFRVPEKGLLLMEDATDPVGFASFLRLSRHLNGLGLSAPKVIGADPQNCLALIEDWGERTYAACLAEGESEVALYALALEALLHLHHAPSGSSVSQPNYDLTVHLTELDIFSDWFTKEIMGDGFDSEAFKIAFRALWSTALQPVAERFDTLVLRDFHVDNLMLLDGREGVKRCGLLDFQDGILGPCEYDLVSLLQDARRDLADGLEDKLLADYIAAAPAHLGGAEAITQRYHLLAAQRHCRIVGVFVRLYRRDGKPRYLSYLPRVISQFETALAKAGLDYIAQFLQDQLGDWHSKGRTIAVQDPE